MKTEAPYDVGAVCAELVPLQYQRRTYIKTRIMLTNRRRAVVAGCFGYHSGMDEADRKDRFREADRRMPGLITGADDHPIGEFARAADLSVRAFLGLEGDVEAEMRRWVRRLPVAAWAAEPEQRGFGLLSLAVVVGECGDLVKYANPAKLWKRMGCAPITFEGRTAMASTWRSGHVPGVKLPAVEWENFGYSPRRRSLAYVIGEGLVKQNSLKGGEAYGVIDTSSAAAEGGPGEGGASVATDSSNARTPGPYRARYDATKARAAEMHPDWPKLRCHLHGMLLATKLLLKNLWVTWHGNPPDPRRWEG